MPSEPGTTDTASVGALATLAPGESVDYPVPAHVVVPQSHQQLVARPDARAHPEPLRHALRDVLGHGAPPGGGDAPAWRARRGASATRCSSSTLPAEVLDAVSANIVPVRSPDLLPARGRALPRLRGLLRRRGLLRGHLHPRLELRLDGLGVLFPQLEREARRIELAIETDDDGLHELPDASHLRHRVRLALGRPAARGGHRRPDGHASCAPIASGGCRGDRAWLAPLWPGIQRAMRFAGRALGHRRRRRARRQASTTPTTSSSTAPTRSRPIYYLAGLRALEELARVMGDDAAAARCPRRASSAASARTGRAAVERRVLRAADRRRGRATATSTAAGCLSDQLLGQLHARSLGLGDLLPPEHVRSALDAIFRHNFRRDFRDHVNASAPTR